MAGLDDELAAFEAEMAALEGANASDDKPAAADATAAATAAAVESTKGEATAASKPASAKASSPAKKPAAAALESFGAELFLQLCELRAMQAKQRFSRTLLGRLYNLLGYFFSGYCVYKVCFALFKIILQRNPRTDPVTRGLEIAIRWCGLELDPEFWAQHISFVFVGVLVFTSVRGFLLAILKIFNQWSSTVSSHSVVLLLAQVMGMYFVSSVLLMRMNLPPQFRRIISDVLGDIKFNFYHRWFDFIFLFR